ncbi:MAG: LPS export ABC transporter permease LptF [Desulfuromonadaceae bacterium GWC2_58_13]|nr:MAG: LPS export ABC transporter permease LptF [Desulfuromonadaceae bacterium GWC2_58_13]
MSSARINIYIAREITVPTVLGLVIFTFILLMGRILKLVELVINKGVPAVDIVKLFCYLLPSFLVITLPLAFLLGVMLGFGRLSADSEIVALKSSGISLFGLSRPVIVLAIAASLITGVLTLAAGPSGNRAFRQNIFQLASNRATIGIQPRVFNDEFDNLVLYASDTDERRGTLEGVMISDQRVEDTPSIILAQRGRVISDHENLTLTLRLDDGSIHRSSPGKDSYQIIKFTTYDLNLNMGEPLHKTENQPHKAADLKTADLKTLLATQDLPAANRQKLAVEFHKRFTYPLAPLIFALIGVPLGIQSHRSGRNAGFSLSLIVFLGYYLSLSLAETLVIETGFPPGISLWLPNLVFLAGGAILFHQTANEKRYAFFDWIVEAPRRVMKTLFAGKGRS